MAFYRSSGENIPFTATADQQSGDVLVIGDLVGIVNAPVSSGETGSLAVEGLFDLPTGGAVISACSEVFWDDTNKVITETSTDNTKVGYLCKAVGASDTIGRVKLSR